jgi:hypothetical protein
MRTSTLFILAAALDPSFAREPWYGEGIRDGSAWDQETGIHGLNTFTRVVCDSIDFGLTDDGYSCYTYSGHPLETDATPRRVGYRPAEQLLKSPTLPSPLDTDICVVIGTSTGIDDQIICQPPEKTLTGQPLRRDL